MRTNPAAVYGASKIAKFVADLFGRSKRTSIALIGDSTTAFGGYGWDAGVVLALESLGVQCWGSGLHGVGEGFGAGFYCASAPNTQNGAYTSLPAEWQDWARNKSGEAGDLGALTNWFITSNQAGGNTGLFVYSYAPFVAEAMTFKLWYATTTATTAGSSLTVAARKQMANAGYHFVRIANFDPSVANTFRLVINGSPTDPITFSSTAATLNANIKTAVEAIAGGTVSISATTSYLGYVTFYITRTIGDLGTVTVDAGGMVPKYAGLGVTSSVAQTLNGTGAYGAIGSSVVLDADQAAGTAIAVYERSIAASASRDFDLGVMVNTGGTTGTAPFLALFYGVSVTGRTHGVTVTLICAVGGQPSRIKATRLIAQTDAFLTEAFRAMAVHAGYASPADHPLLIRISEGLNDKNDLTNSVGPSPAPGNTRAGVFDNLKAIANRIDGIYDAAGWSKANLPYLIAGPQPTESGDASTTFFREGARDFVDWHPRAAMVDFDDLHGGFATDVTQLAGWTGSAADFNHPAAHGFNAWAQYEFDSLRSSISGGRRGITLGTRIGVV